VNLVHITRITRDDERGAALVFIAISMVALLLVAALVIDGGFGYTNRRQMQNAADSAALAGASALQKARFASGPKTGINTAVLAALARNGSSNSDLSLYSCGMLTLAQVQNPPLPAVTSLTPCSSITAATTLATLSNYVGVMVRAGETHSTMLAKIGNQNSQTTRALAAATVQRAKAADGPWTVCGNAIIGGYNFLELNPDTPAPNDYRLRSEALLKAEYGGLPEAPPLGGSLLVDPDGNGAMPRSFPIHGKLEDGAPPGVDPHCGGSGKGLSANWKGLVEPDEIPVVLDSDVDVDNGKRVGQYKYLDTLGGESGCPDTVANIDKGNDDFGPEFDNCLVSVPIFDDTLGGDRVHISTIATFRIFYRSTSTVKYYAQFVCSCVISTGETQTDPSGGGLTAIRLVL
jgi:Flp pilus assembly protein TadG